MATTFNIFMTAKAARFRGDLQRNIFAPYSATERRDMRIVSLFLNGGNSASLGLPGSGEEEYKYIRIVVDIPEGRLKGKEERQELLARTLQACVEYEGKYSDETEIEVMINEYAVEDVLRVVPKGR